MSSQFTRDHIKISVAKILQTLGWHSINTTPLEILTDIAQNYLFQLSKLTNEYANEFGYTEPNLDHLGLAFREMGISLTELEEYVKYVNFGATPAPVCKYPIPKEDQLNFLKPGSKEVVTRPVHIHEHLPPMNPILEGASVEKEVIPPDEIKKEEETFQDTQPVFKKPPDVIPAEFKKPKKDEEGSRPTREISSVMMTTSGFLSPAREGKLPEAKTPAPPVPEPLPPPAAPVVNPSTSEKMPDVVPAKKPPKQIKRIDRKKEKFGKELFRVNAEDGIKKNHSRDNMKTKQLKMLGSDPAFLSNLPQGLNVVKLPPTMSGPKLNSTKFNNKALQAARMKTEKLNTTITPLPMKPVPLNNFPNSTHPPVDNIDKLLTVPDRKKVNILKKISNVKDKIDEKIVIKKEDVKEDPSSPPDLVIDEPEDMIPKLAKLRADITIEPINPPVYNESNIKVEPMYFDDSPPGTPSTPKTPDMISAPIPPVVKEKKKRKPRVRKIPKTETQAISFGTFNEAQALVERPKTPKPEVDLSALHSSVMVPQTPEFPFSNLNSYHLNPGRPNLPFLANFGGPGLIPAPLGNPLNPLSNPLFPSHFPLFDFGQNPYLPQNLPPIPNPIANFIPKMEELPSSSSSVPEPICLPPPRTPEPVTSTTVKPDKMEKKSKEHKKEKKDKLKKKAKKEKLKAKAEKKEEKKRIKKKEKKEKRKEKEIKEDPSSSVLKLTLKLKSPSPRPVTPDTTTKKLNIKAVVKKETDILEEPDTEMSSLAKISALVTGPPKTKNVTPPVMPAFNANYSNPNAIAKKKHKPEYKPIPKLKVEIKKEPIFELAPAPPSKYVDAEGNEVWICPGCSRQDDGSAMIGCDGCDAWYHWVCVGIQVPPDENEDWYCRHCLLKKDEDLKSDKKKKRKRKEKKEHQ